MSSNPDHANNPLITPPQTKHDVPPLDKIRVDHFVPAFKWAIEKARANYDRIKQVKDPGFANVIEAMEHVADDLDRVSQVYSNFKNNLYTADMDAIADEVSSLLTQFSNDVMLDEDLFEQVKAVYDQRNNLDLDEDQSLLLEDSYKSFVRAGALLDEADKRKLRDINEKLSQASTDFGRNIQKYMTGFEHRVSDVAELDGLPERVIEAAAHLAEQKGYEGEYLFTVQPTSYMPVLQYAHNRDLRRIMWQAGACQAMQKGMDNRPVIRDMVRLRDEKAKLLGYDNYAAFVLEERMAGSVDAVTEMLDYFKKASQGAARQEFEELMAYIKDQKGPVEPKPWDLPYYIEKLRQEKYDFDEEELRPYFKFEYAKKGIFATAEKLFGITITQSDAYPVYEDNVFTYEITDAASGDLLGILYADYFPRDTKRPGAWENSYRKGGRDTQGNRIVPVIGVHGSLTPPTADKPALLSYDEVRTMFHEFGHALHDLLTQARYKSQAGTNVKWDFVELPSQILENWLKEKEVLDTFAAHYETGEKIPAELLEKMLNAEYFRTGTGFYRQIELGVLDMAYHTVDPTKIDDVVAFEHDVLQDFHFLPPEPGANISTRFSHLFAGGYAAGYYSYKWAEILEADAFESFKEHGLFNAEIAAKFRRLLEAGGSRDPQKLFEEFKGRKPDPDALLRRERLLPASDDGNPLQARSA